MPRTSPLSTYSLTDETKAEITDLATWWSKAHPLSKSVVVREAVHRCWLAEQDLGQSKNGKKKSNA